MSECPRIAFVHQKNFSIDRVLSVLPTVHVPRDAADVVATNK
jgi:hypothetical protein